MISPKLCIVAEGITRDGETNILTAFNILEAIAAAGFPLFIQHMTCASLWEREDGDNQTANGRFRIVLDNDVLVDTATLLDFQAYRRSRIIIRLAGFVIPRPGRLSFRFELDGGLRQEYAVTVEAQPTIVQAGPAQPII